MTKDRQDKIIDSILKGASGYIAAQATGVHFSQFYRWMKREEVQTTLYEYMKAYRKKTNGKIREERSVQENNDVIEWLNGRPELREFFPKKTWDEIMDKLDKMMRKAENAVSEYS